MCFAALRQDENWNRYVLVAISLRVCVYVCDDVERNKSRDENDKVTEAVRRRHATGVCQKTGQFSRFSYTSGLQALPFQFIY